jgi:glycosyltransferase involved in cell wall biosynthesis
MIVHSHGPRGGLLARKALPAGAISVYTEHIWGPGYHLEDKVHEWAQKKTLRALKNKTNLIIAVSKAVKKYLIDEKLAPEERVVVIPNGISIKSKIQNPNVKLRSKNYNNQIIGTVGSLNKMKGQIYLVEAMGEVVKSYPHAMLEIVGEGEERENLKSQISNPRLTGGQVKLERHVTLLGKRTDVEKIMSRWTIFVLPSIAETFGITILEAYAAGIPVIASNISGVSDLVTNKKTGILVEPEDSTAIASSIIKLLDHQAEAAKLTRGGKEKVKEYEWRKVICEIEQAYINLVESNK